IVERMKVITDAEGVTISSEALETIALAAEGGMRDALSILDQAISYSDEGVELADVLAVTGGVSQQILTNIIEAMYNQDATEALTLLDHLIQQGKDPGRFVYDLIYFLRDLLLYKSAPSLDGILERAVIEETFKRLANEVTVDWIQDAIVKLNECQQEIKWTNSPKVFIEIAILTITNRYDTQQIPNEASVDSDIVTKLTNRLQKL